MNKEEFDKKIKYQKDERKKEKLKYKKTLKAQQTIINRLRESAEAKNFYWKNKYDELLEEFNRCFKDV